MHLLQAGLVDKVLELNTCWSCASCHACEVKCPRTIDIPAVMEALRQLELRKNVNYIEPEKVMAATAAGGPPILYISAFRKLTA
jgi:heterodisulfide reductase subunit C